MSTLRVYVASQVKIETLLFQFLIALFVEVIELGSPVRYLLLFFATGDKEVVRDNFLPEVAGVDGDLQDAFVQFL